MNESKTAAMARDAENFARILGVRPVTRRSMVRSTSEPEKENPAEGQDVYADGSSDTVDGTGAQHAESSKDAAAGHSKDLQLEQDKEFPEAQTQEDAESEDDEDTEQALRPVSIGGQTARALATAIGWTRRPGDSIVIVYMPRDRRPEWKLFSMTRDNLSFKPSVFNRFTTTDLDHQQRGFAYVMNGKRPSQENQDAEDFTLENVYVFGRCSNSCGVQAILHMLLTGPRARFCRLMKNGEDRKAAWRKTVQEYPEPYLWMQPDLL